MEIRRPPHIVNIDVQLLTDIEFPDRVTALLEQHDPVDLN